MWMVGGLILLASAARGAIVTFVGGTDTVGISSPATVAVTVNDFTDVVGFQFTIEWDPSVVQYSSVGNFGLDFLTAGSFGTTEVGSGFLTVAWFDNDLINQTLVNASTLFDINFTSANAPGSTDISFTGSRAPMEVNTFVDPDFLPLDFGVLNGSVTVVPEPLNKALGLFACCFVAAMTARWIFNGHSRAVQAI